MVLVDTSVWINHLQKGSAKLGRLLCKAEVVSHPFVIGELACGNIHNRKEILSLLKRLSLGPVVENNEFHHFLERNKLMGRGLGFVDIHLLASAKRLWGERAGSLGTVDNSPNGHDYRRRNLERLEEEENRTST